MTTAVIAKMLKTVKNLEIAMQKKNTQKLKSAEIEMKIGLKKFKTQFSNLEMVDQRGGFRK